MSKIRIDVLEYPAKKSKSTEINAKIFILNDDCLRVIFSYFGLEDLNAVKKANRRFGPMADEQFRRNFCDHEYTIEPKPDNSGKRQLTCDALNVPISIFYNFGPFFRKMIVRKFIGGDSDKFWRYVGKKCSNLKQLGVYECDLKYFKVAVNNTVSHELEKLNLIDCAGSLDDFHRLVEYAGKLKRLSVRPVYTTGLQCDFLLSASPLLEEIHFEDVEVVKYLYRFIPNKSALRKIHIKTYHDAFDILGGIATSCANVESISIEYTHRKHDFRNIAKLGHLEKLKELQCRIGGLIAYGLEVLAEKNTLEMLGLSSGSMTNVFFQTICKFTNLHTLKLVNIANISDRMLVIFMNKLTLKHIHIIQCAPIGYRDIATAIRTSATLETFSFANYYRRDQMKREHLDGLAQARRTSSANSPLLFFHTPESIDRESVSAEIIAICAADIELREITSFDEYLMRDS